MENKPKICNSPSFLIYLNIRRADILVKSSENKPLLIIECKTAGTEYKKALKYTFEKDKLYYFVLASVNPQKVLVVKSPSDGKEQKAFLGYEWSAAKGNEGIKLTTDSNGKHITPLYDVTNLDNPEKINFL